jgi:hypothetical protein
MRVTGETCTSAYRISYRVYAFVLIGMYRYGVWLVDKTGAPLPDCDFTYWWIGGTAALHGQAASLYDPAQLTALLKSLVGPHHAKDLFTYQNWPYPPVFLLILVPLGLFPYLPAFLIWEAFRFWMKLNYRYCLRV